MRISDWSSDVCSSDLPLAELGGGVGVEVAVATPDRAERNVHIDAELALSDALERRLRQRPVDGCRITGRKCGGHGAIQPAGGSAWQDRKSTRLNSSH